MAENSSMIPQAKIKKTRFSVVWVIPIIALVTGIWMVYQSYSQRGIPITLNFKNGEGIVAGKTILKYSGVQIGIVDGVKLNRVANNVVVTATLEKNYKAFARKESLFWLVKPRLEVGGVSGIETIFTGQYITIRPGKGSVTYNFTALENPPPSDPDSPGLHLLLESKDLGSLVTGSPVLYKKIKVGKVESHSLSEDKTKVFIHILINSEYSDLVKKNTRFWNVSGISVSGDLSGVKIKASSLSSVIDGGIAFETPDFEIEHDPSVNKDRFILYNDRDSAMKRGFPIKIVFETGEGIVPGSTPLKYKGIVIGKVTDVDVEKECGKIAATVLLQDRAKVIASEGSQFWMVKPRLNFRGISGLGTIISGQYIEVKPSIGKDKKTFFTALTTPPFTDPGSPGLHIVLKSNSGKSVSEGSPVYTKGIEAGRVEGYEMTEKGVNISIHIYPEYADKVYLGSRFWSSSGISFKGDLSGVNFSTGTLESILTGSISFDTPYHKGRKARPGSDFILYRDKDSALESGRKIHLEFQSANGLKKGTAIKYKGMDIGKLTKLSFTRNMDKVNAEVTLYPYSPNLARNGSVFYLVSPRIEASGISGLGTIVTGPYINSFMGMGETKTKFIAKDSIPLTHPDFKGRIINIETEVQTSVNQGSPVFYKGMEAGIVKSKIFDSLKDKFIIKAIIYEKYSNLIYKNTKFYNSGGIEIQAGLSGVKLKSENLKSIFLGGISFDNFEKQLPGLNKAKVFNLFKNREKAMEKGFYINIVFDEGYGLKEKKTKILYKGIKIGEVRKINFNGDLTKVIAKTFINQTSQSLVNKNSKFVLRGPEIGFNGVKRVGTIITGSYIELIKGDGGFYSEFTGKKDYLKKDEDGLKLTIQATRLGSLSIGKPVYYRQVKVGRITGFRLNNTAQNVLINISIDKKFAPLVRQNSKFWYTGILSAKIGLTGVKIKTETLETMIKGGVAFATPDKKNMGNRVKDNEKFILHMKPRENWLEWSPRIEINN